MGGLNTCIWQSQTMDTALFEYSGLQVGLTVTKNVEQHKNFEKDSYTIRQFTFPSILYCTFIIITLHEIKDSQVKGITK